MSNFFGNFFMIVLFRLNGLLVVLMMIIFLFLLVIVEFRLFIFCMNLVRMRLCDMFLDDLWDIWVLKSVLILFKNMI